MADELSDQTIQELKEAFAIFDFSNDGTIEGRDLPALLRSLGHDPKEEDLQLFNRLDGDGTGSLDFPEFLAFIAKKMKDAIKSEAELHDAFRVFDRDGTGALKKDEFKQMLDFNGFANTDEGSDLLDRANQVLDISFFFIKPYLICCILIRFSRSNKAWILTHF